MRKRETRPLVILDGLQDKPLVSHLVMDDDRATDVYE